MVLLLAFSPDTRENSTQANTGPGSRTHCSHVNKWRKGLATAQKAHEIIINHFLLVIEETMKTCSALSCTSGLEPPSPPLLVPIDFHMKSHFLSDPLYQLVSLTTYASSPVPHVCTPNMAQLHPDTPLHPARPFLTS